MNKQVDTVRYELPKAGIDLLGYVVRRAHKTSLLAGALESLKKGDLHRTLAQICVFAAAASTSYGKAYYQPVFNTTGDKVIEEDPATGWQVSACLDSSSPHYQISSVVQLPDNAHFNSFEQITGTTVGIRGLGMPAPSRFEFEAPVFGYSANLKGVITSELAFSFPGPWKIRAYGFIDGFDNHENKVHVEIGRNGDVSIEQKGAPGALKEHISLLHLDWNEKV